jgi:hypothetical protein
MKLILRQKGQTVQALRVQITGSTCLLIPPEMLDPEIRLRHSIYGLAIRSPQLQHRSEYRSLAVMSNAHTA